MLTNTINLTAADTYISNITTQTARSHSCVYATIQDVEENSCYRYPKLYIAGQKNENFTTWIFTRTLLKGIYVALAFFFILFGIVAFDVVPRGYEWDYQSFGLAASGALTIIVNLQVWLNDWTFSTVQYSIALGSK